MSHFSPSLEINSGVIISRSGSVSSNLYFLLDGLVRVYVTAVNGSVHLLGFHMANSLFVLDKFRCEDEAIVSIETVKKSSMIAISPEKLRTFCCKYPEFAVDLVLYMGDILRLMCYEATNFNASDVKTRLVNFLCLYLDSTPNQIHSLEIPMTQENIASAINASRVQTARACAELKRDGMIRTEWKNIIVTDEQALRSLDQ